MNLHTFFLDDIYRIFVSTLMDLTYSKPIRTLIFTTFISLCCCSIIVSLNLSLHLSTKIYLCMSISWNFGKKTSIFLLTKRIHTCASSPLTTLQRKLCPGARIKHHINNWVAGRFFSAYISKAYHVEILWKWTTLQDRFNMKNDWNHSNNSCAKLQSFAFSCNWPETWSRCNADCTRCFLHDTSYLRIHFACLLQVHEIAMH